jgi:Fic family protein
MAYHLLKTIGFSNDGSSINERYNSRLHGDATILLDFYPNLMKHNEVATEKYPAFIVFTREIQTLVEEVSRKSDLILSLASDLPSVAHVQYMKRLLLSEIQDTNSIEGVETTLEELGSTMSQLLGETGKDLKMSSTIKQYLDISMGKHDQIHKIEDLRTIYDNLLKGEIEEAKLPDGAFFRKGFVRIGDEFKTIFIPASNEDMIISQLKSWVALINRKDFNFLVKAFASHFVLENIHPFYDGNGRLGRYILSSYLARKLDPFTGVSISSAINRSKSIYYRAFKEAEEVKNFAEVTLFVRDMLGILSEFQNSIIENLSEKSRQLDKITNRILQLVEPNSIEFFILFFVAQSDLFNDVKTAQLKDVELIKLMSKEGFGRDSVKKAIAKLKESNLLVAPKPKPTKYNQHNLNSIFMDP